MKTYQIALAPILAYKNIYQFIVLLAVAAIQQFYFQLFFGVQFLLMLILFALYIIPFPKGKYNLSFVSELSIWLYMFIGAWYCFGDGMNEAKWSVLMQHLDIRIAGALLQLIIHRKLIYSNTLLSNAWVFVMCLYTWFLMYNSMHSFYNYADLLIAFITLEQCVIALLSKNEELFTPSIFHMFLVKKYRKNNRLLHKKSPSN
ncbi:hypothetical protein [Lishizhenia sp.]|uniref:hypothetical protein n=1 Tax=Lishizhenia sp. TaxID=2497594 RepID=UPI00299E8D20|nr:hypothetical protein [Lishizhenia sp.]MDX1446780.1 hypothetical protein [Lishizhenia sp.]